MPSVIINDVNVEAKVGEQMLNVARRNAAHIGFVCDGNGICQTCQCRILSGAEHLSPPSEAERTWMPDHRLRAGHRLACQTVLRGPGPVELLTNAEELRRQLLAVVRPRAGADGLDNLDPLLENLVRMSLDQLLRYPFNIIATLARVGPGRMIYPLRDPERWIDDAGRVTQRMASGVERLERAPHLGTPRPGSLTTPTLPTPLPLANLAEQRLREAARAMRRANGAVDRLTRRAG